MTAASSAAALWLAGALLSRHVGVLRRLHLPASVVAGFLGLALVQTLVRTPVDVDVLTESWSSWPSTLIAIVFAAMLLPGPKPDGRSDRPRPVREAAMVWIIILGETAVGCGVVAAMAAFGDPVPPALGVMIETGFAGGHGTAAAIGEVLRRDTIGVPEGRDIGLTIATIGLVWGLVSGVFWVNVGLRRGWVGRREGQGTDRTEAVEVLADDSPLDRWLMQGIWIALAFGVGLILSGAVSHVGAAADRLVAGSDTTRPSAILGSFPLFIYTLGGGWVVGRVVRAAGVGGWIDRDVVSRLSSIAMDALIIAAIATLDLRAVADNAGVIGAMAIAGAVWTSLALVVLARRVLSADRWFELGLLNYGMSTGTTATGFVLLRIVDPELRSGAAEDYALAAPLSSPFIGGGMITIALPIVVLDHLPTGWVAAGLAVVVITLYVAVRQRTP